MNATTARTIIAQSAGALTLTLTLDPAGGEIVVIGDEHTDRATVILRPIRDGDAMTAHLIAQASVADSVKRLRVLVPKTLTGTIGGGPNGVHITGGRFIAANIGGMNLLPGGGVAAEIRVPAGSTVRLDHHGATVAQSGPVDVDTDW